jgi:hypothetical protein
MGGRWEECRQAYSHRGLQDGFFAHCISFWLSYLNRIPSMDTIPKSKRKAISTIRTHCKPPGCPRRKPMFRTHSYPILARAFSKLQSPVSSLLVCRTSSPFYHYPTPHVYQVLEVIVTSARRLQLQFTLSCPKLGRSQLLLLQSHVPEQLLRLGLLPCQFRLDLILPRPIFSPA